MELPKAFYSAKELAGQPGMPTSLKGVIQMADRENWQFQPRQGRGGGREYSIQSLPAVTRQHLMDRLVASLPQAVCSLPAQPALFPAEVPEKTASTAELKGWQRQSMEARLVFIRLIEQAEPLIGVSKAVQTIVKQAGEGVLPEHVQSLVPVANKRSGGDTKKRALSERSLYRWWSEYKKAGGNCAVLAPKEIEKHHIPSWYPAFRAAWNNPQKISIADAVRTLHGQGITVSYHTVTRYLDKVDTVEKNKGRMGAREIKNIKPFRRRDTSNLLPCDIYTADGHTFDAEVAHPYHGRPFRPEVTLILDVATRMPVGWSVGLAESAVAVVDALRHACERCGIPAIFYTDNGPGYKNEMLGGIGTGLLARLGITAEHSLPNHSQSRGIIERSIQTILVRAAQTLPTYIGAPMDRDAKQLAYKKTRKEIAQATKGNVTQLQDRRLLPTWDEFVELINVALADFSRRPHRGLPRFRDSVTGNFRHYSPHEYWMKAVQQGWSPVMPEAADDLYHPQETRKAIRGEVTLWNNHYYSADLAGYHGEDVIVAYDIHDPSFIWVRDLDQRLICRAKLDGNKSDYFPLSHVEQKREQRADQRLKRLERQIEEIELERKGPAVEVKAEIVLPPEVIAYQEKLVVLEERRAKEMMVPANEYETYQFLMEEKERGGALTVREEEWIADYEHFAATGKKRGLHKKGWQPFAERNRKALGQ